MGLKATNYISKSTGVELPNAYARIKDLVLNGNSARVIFAIQSTRDAIDKYKALDTVEICFTWDRKTDLAEMAYNVAKTQIIQTTHFDQESGKIIPVEVHGVLFGWEDDKV